MVPYSLGDGVNGFTGPERDFEKYLYRYDEATRVLGVDPLARQIYRTLLFEPESTWNVTRLSEKFRHSRPKIREIVTRNEGGGYMLRADSNIYISDKGSQTLRWVHTETSDIAMGRRVGFSEELIRLYRDLNLLGTDPLASTISFQNDINIL